MVISAKAASDSQVFNVKFHPPLFSISEILRPRGYAILAQTTKTASKLLLLVFAGFNSITTVARSPVMLRGYNVPKCRCIKARKLD